MSVNNNKSADKDKQSDYHTPCAIDYNNATSEKVCWEGDDNISLPDLRTEDSGVLATWNTWVGQIVTKYSIDGIRLDSALEVDVDFFSPFEAAGKSAVTDIKKITYGDHS